METVFTLGKPFVVLTSLATLVTILAVTRHAVGQDKD